MTKEYWIVFKDTDRWWKPFVKNGFGHVCVLTKDEYNWYLIDPTMYCLEVVILPYNTNENVPHIYSNTTKSRIIKIKRKDLPKDKISIKLLSFVPCVSHVLYICGIHIFAKSPYSLYNKLLKMSRNMNKKYSLGISDISLVY